MTRIVVKLRAWTPGRLPEILAACGVPPIAGTGGEYRIDKVVPQLRAAGVLVPDDLVADVLAAMRAPHTEIEYAHLDARGTGHLFHRRR